MGPFLIRNLEVSSLPSINLNLSGKNNLGSNRHFCSSFINEIWKLKLTLPSVQDISYGLPNLYFDDQSLSWRYINSLDEYNIQNYCIIANLKGWED